MHLTKKTSLLLTLIVAGGSGLLFLASRQANSLQISLSSLFLLILTGALIAFVLVYFLYDATLLPASAAASDSRQGSRFSPSVSQDLSILSRMQYAIDQHSIISKTDVAGRIIYVNDLFEQVSGYKRNELIGQTHRVIKSDKHSDEFFTGMWQTISEGRIWHGEVCNQRKNGEYYWVESTIVPFVNERGNPYEYISVRTDITKIKKYEEALLKAKNEAEEANQIKSRFLSNISHELRTPLNAILGFTQVLEMNDSIDSEGKEFINEIHKAGNYLVSLFDDLLDMGCVENGTLTLNITELCIYDLLDECIQLSTMLLEGRGIKLISNVDNCQTTFIKADHRRLKQVVLNLLTNAIKYNKENGSVHLQCMKQGDDKILIKISDTGVGMSRDEIMQIFQPFVRVGENQQSIRGTGIGLALSKSIMQKMSGDILVDSVKGEGSVFTIQLSLDTTDSLALAG